MMENEVAILPPKENALQVYSAENGLDPYLSQIRAEIDAFLPDVSTKKGRNAIASIAYKVAKSKTALDNLGRDLVAELKEVPKLIDAERKRMRDLLDAWKDEVRKPLTDFELAEASRIQKHENGIQAIVDIGHFLIGGQPASFGLLFTELELIVVDSSWEEFEARAHREKSVAKGKLDAAFAEQKKRDEEQAELTRLRAEAEERKKKEREDEIARQAAENARLEEQRKADAERQKLKDEQDRKDREAQDAINRANQAALEAENARLRQEQESKRAAEKAEQDKKDAIENERRHMEQERLREQQEAELREKNKAHAKKINNEILEDILAIDGASITQETAKAIIAAIAKGQVRNAKIIY